MKNLMGEQLELFKGAGAEATTLACATSLSVNVQSDSIDISCKQTGKWGASMRGKMSWDASTDCLMCVSDYNELMNAMIDGTPLTLTFATVANYGTANEGTADENGHIFNASTKAESANDLWTGKAVITSISLSADNGSLSTYSVSFQGVGALTLTSSSSDKPSKA